jgi:NAD-dependent SIR2 family protein deacetylase
LFVLTGAGCSTESGIPDYRDAEGQWKVRQRTQFREFVDKTEARQRYWARSMVGWTRFAAARPNPSHLALAALENRGIIRQLVTKNVDGLHQDAGSRSVIDLHGRLDTVSCLSCHRGLKRSSLQLELESLNPRFARLEAISAPDGDAHLNDLDLEGFCVPVCAFCRGTLKPSVVFGGESVPRARVERAMQALNDSDAMLVAGSSLMDYSGFRFCKAAWGRNIPVASVNLGKTRADKQLTVKIRGLCSQVLSDLLARLGS